MTSSSVSGAVMGVAELPAGANPQDLMRYKQLCTNIQELMSQQVEQRASAAASELKSAQAQAKQAATSRDQLAMRVATDQDKLHDAQHPWAIKKVLFSGLCEERLARRHQKLDAHTAQLRQASEVRRGTTTRVAEVNARLQGLQGQVSALNTQRSEQARLINCVLFSEDGSAPFSRCDADDRGLVARLGAARHDLATAEAYLQRYTQALGMLDRGFGHLRRAHGQLRSAFGLAQVDVLGAEMRLFMGEGFVGNSPGDMMVDVFERQQAQEGVRLAQMAIQDILSAEAMFPGAIPYINKQCLRQFGSGWFQILFDNVFTDMMVMRKIQENLVAVEAMERDVGRALSWMQATLQSQAQPDVARHGAAVAALAGQLDTRRRRILDAAAAAVLSSSVQQQQQQAGVAPASSGTCRVHSGSAGTAGSSMVTASLLLV